MSGLSLSSVVKEGEFKFLFYLNVHACMCLKKSDDQIHTGVLILRDYTQMHTLSQLSDW